MISSILMKLNQHIEGNNIYRDLCNKKLISIDVSIYNTANTIHSNANTIYLISSFFSSYLYIDSGAE